MCNKHPREPICQNLIKLIKLNELEFQLAITQQVLKIKIQEKWNCSQHHGGH